MERKISMGFDAKKVLFDEESLILDKPIVCEYCRGPLMYLGLGEYKCQICGEIALDNLGKVQAHLKEHPEAGAFDIAEALGIEVDIVFSLINQGSVDIVKNTQRVTECQKCGVLTRAGRYCEQCTKKLAGDIKKTFYEDSRYRAPVRSEESAKLHFFGTEKWK